MELIDNLEELKESIKEFSEGLKKHLDVLEDLLENIKKSSDSKEIIGKLSKKMGRLGNMLIKSELKVKGELNEIVITNELKDGLVSKKVEKLNKLFEDIKKPANNLKKLTDKFRNMNRYDDDNFIKIIVETIYNLYSLPDPIARKNVFDKLKSNISEYKETYKISLTVMVRVLESFKEQLESNKEVLINEYLTGMTAVSESEVLNEMREGLQKMFNKAKREEIEKSINYQINNISEMIKEQAKSIEALV
ncbi:MAG: hypothetical protein WC307_00865 [Candidatus Nanoarchaeia archaeon]|jgi:hypothetical protein